MRRHLTPYTRSVNHQTIGQWAKTRHGGLYSATDGPHFLGNNIANHRRFQNQSKLATRVPYWWGYLPCWLLQLELLVPMGQYDPQMALKEEPQMVSANSSGCTCWGYLASGTSN